MAARWQMGLAAVAAGIVVAGSAWAHGDVVPHAIDTTGLTPLGTDLQAENPYRGQPDYELAQKIGAQGFNQNCARCHGLGAVSGGIAPDLRLLVPVDDDGYFHYRARTDNMIVSSGYNIAPPEVEAAIDTHPDVVESAVVGKPDPDRGSVVCAFVVLREGVAGDAAKATEIQDHVKAVLAPYKYPRAIEFVQQLPKTQTGKLQRFALRKLAAETATVAAA